ncbi:MAG: L-2-amino-thiazoline-4-carboxylic acid hydrolase [Candidatus Thorarchaeota archaeon]|nr:L-2-amino-thiazoline-4-carboxylic acid hydrolase [Candidatus Thorarchaeota archaeon]
MELDDLDRETEVTGFNDACESERIMYYLAKAGADVVGDENSIEFWKKVVALRLRNDRIEYEKQIKEREKAGKKPITMIENSNRSIKRWTEIGLGDFTRMIMDDHKILYRFDRCVTHEVLKDLNDPEYAYICSCYIGDAPEYNYGNQFLRRTQTLHHGCFCDELYWDSRFHKNPEQPSLEFTKNLAWGMVSSKAIDRESKRQ